MDKIWRIVFSKLSQLCKLLAAHQWCVDFILAFDFWSNSEVSEVEVVESFLPTVPLQLLTTTRPLNITFHESLLSGVLQILIFRGISNPEKAVFERL